MNVSRLIEILEEHIKTHGDGPVAVYNDHKQELKKLEEVTEATMSPDEEDIYGSYVLDKEGTKGLIIWMNEH